MLQDSKSEEIVREVSGMQFFPSASEKKWNGYYLKKSQYLEKKDRDPNLVKSATRGGYLIPRSREDLIEKYQLRYEMEKVYDSILEEPEGVQRLLNLKSWKSDELRKAFLSISCYCQEKGISLKKAKDSHDPYLDNLLRDYEELKEEIEQADREVAYSRLQHSPMWKDPRSLPEELSPVGSLSADMLPLSLRGWLVDISERMQVPLDFPAAACVVILSSLIGRKVGVHPKQKDDWLVIPNLWGAIVGRPSLLKSPAVAEVMHPLRQLVHEANQKHEEDRHLFEEEQMLYEAKQAAYKDNLRRQAKQAISEGGAWKGMSVSLDGCEKPPTPILKRYKTEDATVPKIAMILQENPQGILLHRDELTAWLKNLEQSGHEPDRSFYLEAWDGKGSFTVDRVERGTLHVPALCLSILGSIQPGPLSSYVEQASQGGKYDDGLLQRFQLLVWPDPSASWENIDRSPDLEARERAYAIFQILDKLPIPDEEGCGLSLRFSLEAQERFDAWRGNLENRIRSKGLSPALESHLAKYRSLVPSLALIFHLLEVLEYVEASGCSYPPITIEALDKALRWCSYLESHAGRLYHSCAKPGLLSARSLLGKIQEGELKEGFSVRDVYYGKHWSHLSSAQEARQGLEVLEEFGWLKVSSMKTGGRDRITVHLHPHLQQL